MSTEQIQQCEWFALCTNPATASVDHPVLGAVPTCDRCQERFALTPADVQAARLSLTRDSWDKALLSGDTEAADRYAAEVQRLEQEGER